MTRDRKIAIVVLTGTLLAGILIGLWIPSLYQRSYRGNKPTGSPRSLFEGKLYRVLKPDSAQKVALKPITQWAMLQLDSIENASNIQVVAVLDSMKQKMGTILTAEQQERLRDFDLKARQGGRYHGRKSQRP